MVVETDSETQLLLESNTASATRSGQRNVLLLLYVTVNKRELGALSEKPEQFHAGAAPLGRGAANACNIVEMKQGTLYHSHKSGSIEHALEVWPSCSW